MFGSMQRGKMTMITVATITTDLSKIQSSVPNTCCKAGGNSAPIMFYKPSEPHPPPPPPSTPQHTELAVSQQAYQKSHQCSKKSQHDGHNHHQPAPKGQSCFPNVFIGFTACQSTAIYEQNQGKHREDAYKGKHHRSQHITCESNCKGNGQYSGAQGLS